MCRNIRTLFNDEPPASDAEVRDAALQCVRKLSGFSKPSQANQAVFDEVARIARGLVDALVTNAAPRGRTVETGRARQRSATRFGIKAP